MFYSKNIRNITVDFTANVQKGLYSILTVKLKNIRTDLLTVYDILYLSQANLSESRPYSLLR